MKSKIVSTSIVLLAVVTSAHSETWNFTYTGSGYGTFSADQITQHNNPGYATGSITGDYVNGTTVAITSGFIDISQGAITGHFNLAGTYTLTGYNSNFFIYNNLFYPSSQPQIDYLGLLFENNDYLVNLGYGTYWSGRPRDYGWFIASVTKTGRQIASSDVLGSMTISQDPGTNVVPEPGEWTAMAFLGAGLLGLMLKKRTKTG